MKAVCCSVCGRLTAEGDYGKLLIAVAGRHRNTANSEDSRFAAEASLSDPPTIICKGSGTNGTVTEIPDRDDGFAPWDE